MSCHRSLVLSFVALGACAAPVTEESASEDLGASRAPHAVMDAYFRAWMGEVHETALRAVLAPNVHVELSAGPVLDSADAYVALITGPGGGAIRCGEDRFIQKVYGAREGSFLYECDTPAGPLVFSETLTVTNGRVSRIRGVADMTAFGQAMANVSVLASIGPSVFAPKDPSGYDAVLDGAFVAHTGGQDLDREGFKAFTGAIFAALPDFDEHLHVIEANATGAVAIALVTGTHTGAPLFRIPATGKRVSFTTTHIYRMNGQRALEDWAEADLAAVVAQLTQGAPAPTMAEMEAAFASAESQSHADCPPAVADPVSTSLWPAWGAAIRSGDEAAVRALHAPHFRRSFGVDSIDGGIDAVLGGLAVNHAIGTVTSMDNVTVRYAGNRVIGAAGKVDFAYHNPTGAFGLPARATPKQLQVGEVHVLRACGGKITRQYSNVDALGLVAHASQP